MREKYIYAKHRLNIQVVVFLPFGIKIYESIILI